MPRKNFNTKHGRRLAGHPTTYAGEANTIGPEGMARSLVERGLASETILDYPTRLDRPTPARNSRKATVPSDYETEMEQYR
jgi:hypothetical protein